VESKLKAFSARELVARLGARVEGAWANRAALAREKALRTASEERFRRYFELGLIGMAITSPEKGYLEVNDELCRILGYERAELLQKTWAEMTHPDDLAPDVAQFQRVLSGEIDGYTIDKRWIRKDGRIVHSIMSARCLRADGAVEYLVGLVQDITARKRTEESLQRAQADLAHIARIATMGEMASSIAHELNQPLAAVVANANACARWLATQPPNLPEANEAVARIVRDGKRASEVIARIRAFVGRRESQKSLLRLDDVTREALSMMTAVLRGHGVALSIAPAAQLPPVMADRVQVQQVILNFVMNAVEAMERSTERTLMVGVDAYGAGALRVWVRDSGAGLDPAHRDRIFDAFYTTKPNGMGMGLAISRSIVEAHGGRLWATPNDGPGETFQFTLPVRAA
jgi:PAS domain S-box-containing protein